jgi:SnoaL-like domain
VDKAAVDRWLEGYVSAWKSYDPRQIEALFAADVAYRYHPYDEPVEGRDAVVASWLGEDSSPDVSTRDEPGTYDANYHAVAVDGLTAVATGSSQYRDQPGGPITHTFDNCFVIQFDEGGRCTDFVEWFIERPAADRNSSK